MTGAAVNAAQQGAPVAGQDRKVDASDSITAFITAKFGREIRHDEPLEFTVDEFRAAVTAASSVVGLPVRAAVTAASSVVGLPEGWVAVPRDPSEAMWRAHWKCLRLSKAEIAAWFASSLSQRGPNESACVSAWHAMLDAAPSLDGEKL
ncbi:hypothetical protein [Caulobacter sp. BP25]|uniref:hypothetical protein n=1 Tax=Caulobacter sp. BP25 TaxID=2048900 RepID=UPI000C12D4C7|nr:hypothetical protein [Caulobacter sp. BP25]PHY20898.1 hypothetical protein CSW59_06720 [Caulobacter sp. BP25]